MKDMIEVFIIIATIIGLITVLVLGSYSWQCSVYENVTGRQTKFTGMNCYVKDNGQWYVWSEYKNRLVAKGSMNERNENEN